MEEVLIVAIIFNVLLLLIAYFSGSRAVVIVSSLIWILIGFELFQTYPDVEGAAYQIKTIILAVTYLIAFAQIFIPLNSKNLPN